MATADCPEFDPERFDRDKDDVVYQHPERSCLRCKFYKCMDKDEWLDYAKYGCVQFEEGNTIINEKI